MARRGTACKPLGITPGSLRRGARWHESSFRWGCRDERRVEQNILSGIRAALRIERGRRRGRRRKQPRAGADDAAIRPVPLPEEDFALLRLAVKPAREQRQMFDQSLAVVRLVYERALLPALQVHGGERLTEDLLD